MFKQFTVASHKIDWIRPDVIRVHIVFSTNPRHPLEISQGNKMIETGVKVSRLSHGYLTGKLRLPLGKLCPGAMAHAYLTVISR